ncbi:MAG: MinD/ParA family protein [Negativicutes bacterium]|nr:MinD/ParA family protein [Negativicutes bacterium]
MRDQAYKLRQIVKGSNVVTNVDESAGPASGGQPVEEMVPDLSNPPPVRRPRIITVTSGKGGVGKTNITVNLALALAQLNQKVVLIDADVGMANVDVLMKIRCNYGLVDLASPDIALSDVVTDVNDIKIVSGGQSLIGLGDMDHAALLTIIDRIRELDEWADFIIFDTGAGINRNILSFLMAAEEILIVTTPEPTAITDAYTVMKVYTKSNGKSALNLIVNRAVNEAEANFVSEKLQKVAGNFLGVKLINFGYVNDDKAVLASVKEQTPFVLAAPNSQASVCIKNLAAKLLHGDEAKMISQPKGLKTFFYKLVGWR